MHTTSGAFVPPHCPRSDCRFHRSAIGWRWIRHGSFFRLCEPRRIQRFRCLHCGATFSTQTFSTTYYLKRPELLEPLAHRLLACSGYRQIAREARCDPTTVMGLAARLGRHALLTLHERRPSAISEPLVVDGFESFAYSQFQPLHLNLAVGAESHFTYGFTFSPLRRKGSMTAKQRLRRKALEDSFGRPDPKAIERGMSELIALVAPTPRPLTLYSDEHPAYPRAWRRLTGYPLRHERTSSLAARTPLNPLFAVNLVDLLLRHNSANHKRETIAFSKRHQAVIERAALLLAWRNWVKPFSERERGPSAAMRLGLETHRWSMSQLLAGRRFVTRIELPRCWRDYYWRRVDTPGIDNPRRHTLKRAT
jgi:transposase-like protein